MRSFQEVAAQSTCLKRVTVCELYDRSGHLLARESNRCDPPDGECARVGVVSIKKDYPAESTCNWTHAEIMALNAMQSGDRPVTAIVYGHNFPCPSCDFSLHAAGVEEIKVKPETFGCGLRK